MILMFLGSLTLLLFGFWYFFDAFQKMTVLWQRSLLDRKSTKTLPLVFENVVLDILSASQATAMNQGAFFWNLKLKGRRESILRFCLSPMSWIVPLLVCSLFLSFNGFFILGISFVGFFILSKNRSPRPVWGALMGLGIYLVGCEMVLRQTPVILNLLGTSPFAFFLADGRFGPVLTLLTLGLVLSLFLKVHSWSLFTALALLITQTISLNGAMGLVVGEILALPILLCWRARKITEHEKKVLYSLSVTALVGGLLGFWIAGEARSFLNIGFDLDFSAVQERKIQFLMLVFIVLSVQLIVLMSVGHFLALEPKKQPVENSDYAPPEWIEGLDPVLQRWTVGRIKNRLNEIRYHIQGLKSLPSDKVPLPVQERLFREEKQLSQYLLESSNSEV